MHKTIVGSLAILVSLSPASQAVQAVVYNVNRSFSDASSTATLTGTVSLPTGFYVIQNRGASPFTNVNLSLTVNAMSFNLHNTVTSGIFGGGQFNINATPEELIFSTAFASGSSPADLVFSQPANGGLNSYFIGTDGAPGFETAYAFSGLLSAPLTFPVVFGTAIPEPSTLVLLGIGAISLLGYRKAESHG